MQTRWCTKHIPLSHSSRIARLILRVCFFSLNNSSCFFTKKTVLSFTFRPFLRLGINIDTSRPLQFILISWLNVRIISWYVAHSHLIIVFRALEPFFKQISPTLGYFLWTRPLLLLRLLSTTNISVPSGIHSSLRWQSPFNFIIRVHQHPLLLAHEFVVLPYALQTIEYFGVQLFF